MDKQVLIHKKNELVRGTDKYSLNAKRALNAIYWGIQKNSMYDNEIVIFKFSTLRKLMGLQKDERYIQIIKKALIELQEPMQLNNFYHPIQKKKFKWYSMSFLDEAGFEQENINSLAYLTINPSIKYLMQIDGNFTELELVETLNRFRTKYSMKIYEYLKSFEGYQYLDISQEHLIALLSIKDNPSYKYYSDLERLVQRQLKELIKKSDLKNLKLQKNTHLKKSKIYRFIINIESDKITPTKQELESTLKKLITKF
jgi:hypothetical protein